MNILNFLIENWDFLLLIVLAVAAVGYFSFKGNKSVITKMLHALVTEAEATFGSGTGSLKLAAVIAEVYPKLPAVIKLFITEATLTKWIEDVLAAAKKEWANNSALAEYIEGNVPEIPNSSEEEPADNTFIADSYN